MLMGIHPEPGAQETLPEGHGTDGEPGHQPIAGNRDRQSTPGQPCRRSHQSVDVGIAAHDPVEANQVGGLEGLGRGHEVAVHEAHPRGQTKPLGLLPGGGQIRPRGVGVDGRGGPGLEQQTVQPADPAADVEDGQPDRRWCGEGLGQHPSRSPRAVAPERPEITPSRVVIELVVIATGAGRSRHRPSLPRQARTSWRMNAT
jgi:hypothetical protein